MGVKGELHFSGGRKAKIQTSSLETLRNSCIITGTKGQVILHTFWSATTLTDIDGSSKSWPLSDAKHSFYYPNGCGLKYQTIEVKRCIRAGLLECETVSHNESLLFARIEDEIRRQMGVTCPEDEETF